ncbi:hypothetical protein ACI2LC_42180 [Nonomuraea wenchangensis]|uniref:hypothetical protein n=1 Tax=Nonomuraea wenchangensis TaxID=568860 RepID=UPI00340F64DA
MLGPAGVGKTLSAHSYARWPEQRPLLDSANFSDFTVNSFCSSTPTPNCSRSLLDVALASD